MHRGYVRIWRKIFDDGIHKNQDLFIFWIYCLCKATHKERKERVNFQEVVLLPGQFIYGRKAAAKSLFISESSARRCLDALISAGNLASKPTNKFSVITVLNWKHYQRIEDEPASHPASNPANKRPTNGQQTATNKNIKNEKNEKNKEDDSAPPITNNLKKCFEEIAAEWNSSGKLRKCEGYSEKRIAALGERMRNAFFVKNWKAAIRKLENSSYATGQLTESGNGRKSDIAWFLSSDEAILNALEGKYDDFEDDREERAAQAEGGRDQAAIEENKRSNAAMDEEIAKAGGMKAWIRKARMEAKAKRGMANERNI